MKNQDKFKLKAGLEIHQQLNTGKLFCRCPSILRNDEPDWVVKRKLHAVAGETGEIDNAVKHEKELDRTFTYQGYSDTNCLVEFDEAPPLEIDKEALKIVVQIAIILNCKILSVSQIMRKTVIDGSNTSGFQRTVLIARDGYIETSLGKVKIEGINLEEDSARIISKTKERAVYRLDRLGVPLIEISTAADLKTPEHIKETALKIGEILRAFKIKRGIGTIRQDVNISTPGHPRIEIKGFQEPKMFISVINNEIKRQQTEVLSNKPLEKQVRQANIDGSTIFLRPMPGAARMYPETDLLLLKISKQFIDQAKKEIPKTIEDQKRELKQKGLNEEQAVQLIKSGKFKEFENLVKIYSNPEFIFKAILIFPKEIASHNNLENYEDIFNEDVIESIIQEISKKTIEEQDIKQVLENIANKIPLENALKIEKIDSGELESEIAKIIKRKPNLSSNAYMGLVMKDLKGKISGKEAKEIINKILK